MITPEEALAELAERHVDTIQAMLADIEAVVRNQYTGTGMRKAMRYNSGALNNEYMRDSVTGELTSAGWCWRMDLLGDETSNPSISFWHDATGLCGPVGETK